MLKSKLSKKDDIIFDLLQIVNSFKENQTLIHDQHDISENPLVQTSIQDASEELQTRAEQGRHDNEGTTITSADNRAVWKYLGTLFNALTLIHRYLWKRLT